MLNHPNAQGGEDPRGDMAHVQSGCDLREHRSHVDRGGPEVEGEHEDAAHHQGAFQAGVTVTLIGVGHLR